MAYIKEGNSVHLIQLVTKLKTTVYSLFEEKEHCVFTCNPNCSATDPGSTWITKIPTPYSAPPLITRPRLSPGERRACTLNQRRQHCYLIIYEDVTMFSKNNISQNLLLQNLKSRLHKSSSVYAFLVQEEVAPGVHFCPSRDSQNRWLVWRSGERKTSAFLPS